ncbi:MAG TPA: hypothetical protein VLD57_05550 [Blastocatellia bacterium]|nr:hypothetical protein [Blastocatellia bacterium]
MTWQGEERRSGSDRRLVERRRTTRYDVKTLIVVNGITWIEERGAARRTQIRRRADREKIASLLLSLSRPD